MRNKENYNISKKVRKNNVIRFPFNLTKIIYFYILFYILYAFSICRHAEMNKRNLLQLTKKRRNEIKEYNEKVAAFKLCFNFLFK